MNLATTFEQAVARIVQARAQAIVNESSKGYLDVSLDDALTTIENDYRTYDKMMETLDYYFDDWARELAERLGVVDA